MDTLASDLETLRSDLKDGSVSRAYRAIIGFMARLRAHAAGAPGDTAVSGIYQGSFDMTYYALMPPVLRSRDLKLAIVFAYETFDFQVWLAARNRAVQRRFSALLREKGWPATELVEPAPGVDAIVVRTVADALALTDAESLTARIHEAVAVLQRDVERFLEVYDDSHLPRAED